MNIRTFSIIPLGVLLLLPFISACASTPDPTLDNYADPVRFEKAIAAFEAADQKAMPPEGAVLCIGSSSMGGWHGTIKKDLAPLTVIPRGFGGSTMHDLLHFTDRVVIPYKPRAILIYEGDNDVSQKVSPEAILATFKQFTAKVHAALPDTRIYMLAIKPSISRWKMWPEMEEANRLLEQQCKRDKRMTYIDIATPMLNEAGTPMESIFLKDMLHMNAEGYKIWTKVVRPVLVDREKEYEKN